MIATMSDLSAPIILPIALFSEFKLLAIICHWQH